MFHAAVAKLLLIVPEKYELLSPRTYFKLEKEEMDDAWQVTLADLD